MPGTQVLHIPAVTVEPRLATQRFVSEIIDVVVHLRLGTRVILFLRATIGPMHAMEAADDTTAGINYLKDDARFITLR